MVIIQSQAASCYHGLIRLPKTYNSNLALQCLHRPDRPLPDQHELVLSARPPPAQTIFKCQHGSRTASFDVMGVIHLIRRVDDHDAAIL